MKTYLIIMHLVSGNVFTADVYATQEDCENARTVARAEMTNEHWNLACVPAGLDAMFFNPNAGQEG